MTSPPLRSSRKNPQLQNPLIPTLLENEQTFQAIFNATYQLMALLTPQGVILKVNHRALELSGVSSLQIIGELLWKSKLFKISPVIRAELKKAILKAKHEHFVRLEFDDKTLDDKTIFLDFSLKPVTNSQGKVILVIAEARDITERKNLDELRKEFLSAAAHELKTPITVLKLLTQSHLKKAAKTGSDSIKANELELIDKELDRLTLLINDLLDSSRFEMGKLSMQYQIINLSEMIPLIVKKIKVYARDHEFVINPLPKKIEVIADPLRIEQVLLNLLSNAVKYSPTGKSIILEVKKEKKMAVVSIEDFGRGIPFSKQRLIFDKYYQIKSKSNNGFGLGLYISKEIVKRHKGKIWVNSQKGKGSTFFFSLPLHIERSSFNQQK